MSETISQRLYQIIQHPYVLPTSLVLGSYFLYTTFSSKPAPIAPSAPHKCRFRLDQDATRILTLPDGRQLGYAEYGAPNGRAILGMHGGPGSRMEWAFWDEMGKKYNARFIGVDRPGHGLSSPQPRRRVVDFAKDVECLTEHLQLEEYAVVGCSGGGPSALACAHSLPANKLKGAASVVGVGPNMNVEGIGFVHWVGFGLKGLRYAPWSTRLFFKCSNESQTHLDDEEWLARWRSQIFGGKPHPKDVALGVDPQWRDDFLRVVMVGMREAFRQGLDGAVEDGRASASDWGFKVEDIRPELPLQLWYGKHDHACPAAAGEDIARRKKGKVELHIEDETHVSLYWNCMERIVQDLIGCFEEKSK